MLKNNLVITIIIIVIHFLGGCATTSNIQPGCGTRSSVLDDSGFATEVQNLLFTQSIRDNREMFTNDEKEIIYFAIFARLMNLNLFNEKKFTVEWIGPSGEIYKTDKLSAAYANHQLVYAKLDLKNTPAAEMLGKWTCKFYREGDLLDESSFVLESPGVREKRLAEIKKMQEETQISKIKETFDWQKGIVYEMNLPQQITKIVSENNEFVALLIIVNEDRNIIGTGSGFLVGKNGMLATNYHVIKNAKGGVAKFPNKKIYAIQSVEAVDTRRDIALIKIDYANDKHVAFGSLDQIQTGERVVAIGSPFALENSVSDGLVSGIRKVNDDFSLMQISVAISPGSSGGPLFNLAGKVLGITSSGLALGRAQNINFAVPIDYVKELMKSRQPVSLNIDPTLITKFEGYQQFKNRSEGEKRVN